MAQFTVRVELHGGSQPHYDLLHSYMTAKGFNRYIEGVTAGGVTGVWDLPTAEYDHESLETCEQIRDKVKSLADSVWPGAWVLVTQVASRSWTTRKHSN